MTVGGSAGAVAVVPIAVSIARRKPVVAVGPVLRQQPAPPRLRTAVRLSQPCAVDEHLAGRKAQHPACLERRLMGGDDDRGPCRRGLFEQALHDLGVLLVDRSQRLVGKKHAWAAGKGARHRHPLPFAR